MSASCTNTDLSDQSEGEGGRQRALCSHDFSHRTKGREGVLAVQTLISGSSLKEGVKDEGYCIVMSCTNTDLWIQSEGGGERRGILYSHELYKH